MTGSADRCVCSISVSCLRPSPVLLPFAWASSRDETSCTSVRREAGREKRSSYGPLCSSYRYGNMASGVPKTQPCCPHLFGPSFRYIYGVHSMGMGRRWDEDDDDVKMQKMNKMLLNLNLV